MKKFIFGLLLILLLGAGAALFYVMHIDWNDHKDKIAQQFYTITGKEIVLEGHVRFDVFPVPSLRASRAKVYNGSERDRPLMDVQNVMAELSLSSLLKKEFHVTKMVLDGAVINIDFSQEGFNWQGDLSADQRQMMEESNTVLNSVALKNAEVNIFVPGLEKELKLTNLNGEVSAQSVFGPFRIEGNYLKGDTTEGFALTVGKLSENFSTALNGVVTHPQSDSYVRFDGTFNLNNKLLNGNVVVESKNMSDFVNANNDTIKLSKEYNHPAALGFDIVLNDQNLALSNVVVKYGETQGSGTFQMALSETEKPKVEIEFNFSDLELDPFVKELKTFYETYRTKPYRPAYDVELSAQVNALRAKYDGQGFKNLRTKFWVEENEIVFDMFSLTLPGETDLSFKGNIYPNEEAVFYQGDVSVVTSDLLGTLQWLKLTPKVAVGSVFKKMNATAKIAGNFEKLQVSPYELVLDKTTFSGEGGIVFGKRKDAMLIVQFDSLNLDNYLSPLPDEEKAKKLSERVKYRFSKIGALKDFDFVLDAKANLVIYENIPFEKVVFKGNLLNGILELDRCQFEQGSGTSLSLNGKLKGLGSVLEMAPLRYSLKSSDIPSLLRKFELEVWNLDYKKAGALSVEGTLTGTIDTMGIDTTLGFGSLNAAYRGQIFKKDAKLNYKGELDLRYPDFAGLLEMLNVGYRPQAQNLGVFQFRSPVMGTPNRFQASEMLMNIGYSSFSGSLDGDFSGERPRILADLKINKFEADKFLPKKDRGAPLSVQEDEKQVSFLKRPLLSKDKIDYSWYLSSDVKGKFEVSELSYLTNVFKNAKFEADLTQGTLKVRDFSAQYNNAFVDGEASLSMGTTPQIDIRGNLKEAVVNDFETGGSLYALKGGKFSAKVDLSSAADSAQSFVSNLKGNIDFEASETAFEGVDLAAVHDDLSVRQVSEGLTERVTSFLKQGRTPIQSIAAKLLVEDGKYKFVETSVQAPNTEVNVSGGGDFGNWDMDVSFEVKHEEPNYLLPYFVSFKGGMDDPTVEANVSNMLRLYQTEEDKKVAAREAEIELEKTRLEDRAAEQKKTADDLIKNTREKLEKEIEEKSLGAFSSESLNQYTALKQNIAGTLASLVENMDALFQGELSDERIDKMSQANKKALSEIETFSKKVDQIYLQDLRAKVKAFQIRLTESYNAAKQSVFSYNTQFDKYKEKLSGIETTYSLDKDETLQALKQKAREEISAMEVLARKASRFGMTSGEEETAETCEVLVKDLEETRQLFDERNEVLVSLSKEIETYVLPKIAAEESLWRQKQEEEENKRKVEENTGSIHIKKTGQTRTVVRGIEEIKSSEEEVQNEGIKVLDFSREKYVGEEKTETPNENVIKKGRNILIN